MKFRIFISLILTVCGTLLSGCSTHTAFTYPVLAEIQLVKDKSPDVKVAVLPAKDYRHVKNVHATSYLCWIPLMPLGWSTNHRPEAGDGFLSIDSFRMNMTEDVPKAIARHLQEAGMAKRVFFDYGGNVGIADYILETEIRESRYDKKIYSYGVSFFAPLFWMLGVPKGTSDFTLRLEMVLRNKAGKEVWRYSLGQEWGLVQGYYYNLGRDMEGLAAALQIGMERMLKTEPPPFH